MFRIINVKDHGWMVVLNSETRCFVPLYKGELDACIHFVKNYAPQKASISNILTG